MGAWQLASKPLEEQGVDSRRKCASQIHSPRWQAQRNALRRAQPGPLPQHRQRLGDISLPFPLRLSIPTHDTDGATLGLVGLDAPPFLRYTSCQPHTFLPRSPCLGENTPATSGTQPRWLCPRNFFSWCCKAAEGGKMRSEGT